jgi:SAM-dependent methyltransferase
VSLSKTAPETGPADTAPALPVGLPICPLCDGQAGAARFPYSTRWNDKQFTYVGCTRCGATFIDPMPDDADFAAMYSQEQYHDLHYATEDDTTGAGALAQVAMFLKPGGRLLDYGCGNGAFLKQAARAGYAAEGIELDAGTIAQAARLSGCPVHSLDDALAAGLRFDAIHLGDVLEHLPRPGDTLHLLDRLLAPGGVYFIEGPLEDNPGAVLFASRLFGTIKRRARPASIGSFVPYHLTRVSAGQQRRFFVDAGYAVRLFTTQEDGWPYRSSSPGSSGTPIGNAARIRHAIAGIGIATAAIGNRFALTLGNRFVAILQPAGG